MADGNQIVNNQRIVKMIIYLAVVLLMILIYFVWNQILVKRGEMGIWLFNAIPP